MPTPEELARQNIDALLEQCGWIIQNYKQLDLSAGRGIAIREVRLKEGRCDYLLLIDRKPVGIIVLCGCFRLFPKRRRHRCLAVTDAQQRPGFPSKCSGLAHLSVQTIARRTALGAKPSSSRSAAIACARSKSQRIGSSCSWTPDWSQQKSFSLCARNATNSLPFLSRS